MLTHYAKRPLTMKRFPDGVREKAFTKRTRPSTRRRGSTPPTYPGGKAASPSAMSASMICRPWYGAPISDPDKIARAIFAGFQSELLAQDAGLVELQFPVGTGTQDRLFGVVQDDLAGTNLAAAAGAGAAAPGGGIQILHLPAHKRPTLANGKDPKPDKKGGEGVDDDGDAIELQNTQAAARAQANAGRAVVAGLSGQQWLLKKKAWKYVDGTSTQQAGVTADRAANTATPRIFTIRPRADRIRRRLKPARRPSSVARWESQRFRTMRWWTASTGVLRFGCGMRKPARPVRIKDVRVSFREVLARLPDDLHVCLEFRVVKDNDVVI